MISRWWSQVLVVRLCLASARDCIQLVELDGVDVRPLRKEFVVACGEDCKGCGQRVLVLGLGAVRSGRLARQLGEVNTKYRRELRFSTSQVVERAKAALDTIDSVVLLEDEPKEIAAALNQIVFSETWLDAVLETQALNFREGPNYSNDDQNDLAVYTYGRSLAMQNRPRSSFRTCPDMTNKKYLWMHSYGYAPLEPIRGEGLNGWRIVFSRVLKLAKELNASIILPCARHSVLVPCGLSGPLAMPDTIGNSADDDYVEDPEAGIDVKMRKWLDLFALTFHEEGNYDDDASRGLLGLRDDIDDLSAYFDLDHIIQYLNGAQPLTVKCLSEDQQLLIHLKQFRADDSMLRENIATFFHEEKRNNTNSYSPKIAKLNGGFSLGTMRSVVPSIIDVETGPLFTFSKRLHAEAHAFQQMVFNGQPFTAIHWRAETLIARRDPLAPRAFTACANALLSFAQNITTPVLLISDIPYQDDAPSWLSFDHKLHLAHPQMRRLVRNFISAWPYYKYDSLLQHLAPGTRIDLGDFSIIDQILSLDASLLATHYDHPNSTLSAWNGVGFNDCGYSGRFIRTILSRRLHTNRTIANWYPPAGFPTFRSPSASRTATSRPTSDRLARED